MKKKAIVWDFYLSKSPNIIQWVSLDGVVSKSTIWPQRVFLKFCLPIEISQRPIDNTQWLHVWQYNELSQQDVVPLFSKSDVISLDGQVIRRMLGHGVLSHLDLFCWFEFLPTCVYIYIYWYPDGAYPSFGFHWGRCRRFCIFSFVFFVKLLLWRGDHCLKSHFRFFERTYVSHSRWKDS